MASAKTTVPDDKSKTDEKTLPQAAWRSATVYAAPIRNGDKAGPDKEQALPPPLLEYAAFLLDQEAEYCQE